MSSVKPWPVYMAPGTRRRPYARLGPCNGLVTPLATRGYPEVYLHPRSVVDQCIYSTHPSYNIRISIGPAAGGSPILHLCVHFRLIWPLSPANATAIVDTNGVIFKISKTNSVARLEVERACWFINPLNLAGHTDTC